MVVLKPSPYSTLAAISPEGPVSLRFDLLMVAVLIASLNVTVTVTFIDTRAAPFAGATETIVGGMISGGVTLVPVSFPGPVASAHDPITPAATVTRNAARRRESFLTVPASRKRFRLPASSRPT